MEEKRFFRVNAQYAVLFLIIMLIMPANFVLAADMIEEFYPLHQGNAWTYAITEDEGSESEEETLRVNGEEIVSGINTVKLYSEGDEYECFAFGSEGVKKYKTVDLEDKNYQIFNPPVITIPNIEIGGSVSYSTHIVSNALDNKKTGEFKENAQIKLVSVEDVVVPAGKFSGCLKFSFNADRENADSYSRENCIFWLARGVGKVKEVCIDTEGSKDKKLEIDTEKSVLISAIIDGKKIGGR